MIKESPHQIGTCIVFRRHGCYPAAECTECDWRTEQIYEDELARRVAEHSRLHRGGGAPTTTVGTFSVTVDGKPIL